jgi:hypothetical protein
MWMVFNGGVSGSAHMFYIGTKTFTSVAMHNSKLIVGYSDSYGIGEALFLADVGYPIRRASASYMYKYKGGIAQRNAGLDFYAIGASTDAIVNNAVNDIAMTVLPNAPIDSTTNLPVPTIAIASNGGVSVIKDDGSVVDITASSYSMSANITFTAEQRLFFSFDAYTHLQRYFHVYDIPSSNISTTHGYLKGNALEFYTARPESSPDLMLIQPMSSATLGPIADYSFGLANGLARVEPVTVDPASGMVSFITSDYNTGWMNGDIKLAALSDTDDTDVTGSELFSGDAASDDTNSVGNWSGLSGATTTVNSTASYVNSGSYSIRIAGSGSGAGARYYNAGILTSGTTYTITFSVNSADGEGVQWVAGSYNGGSDYGGNDGIISASNTWYIQTLTFTATTSNLSITLLEQGGGNSPDIYVDAISVRLAEQDRSVNGNGLQVHGTIDKDPVATGADLVAYSGFSSSNYLEQPYNSDLDFGTGDFSVMGWTTDGGDGVVLLEKSPPDAQTDELYLYTGSNSQMYYKIDGNQHGTGYSLADSWQHLVLMRRDGVVYFYANGVLQHTQTDSGNVGGAEHILRVGTGIKYPAADWNGSLALLRISATAPTAEQIAKIYRDEKPLFQENAKATIAGASDAVTALAYDDDTGLLHVGSSWGRSVFQGLKRVDYSTDVVSSCISAANGLVAED